MYFFLRKDITRAKTLTSKNEITKQKQTNSKQQRQQFLRVQTSKRVKVAYFALAYSNV